MSEMNDKVGLITGASSGIGRATAELFAANGAKVVLAARRQGELDSLVAEIEAQGGTASAIKTDVSQAADVERMVDHVIKTFGRLDYAVNNAGIEGQFAPVVDLAEEDWDQVMGINLKGTFLCMKQEARAMLAGDCRGAIVKEPLNNSARARRRLCGRPRLGLGERGLVIPNKGDQTRRRPRKGPSRQGFAGKAASPALRRSVVAQATVTRVAPHDLRLFRLKRAPRRVIQRFLDVGSVNSFLGFASGAAYCTSKHGLIGLTTSVSAELASQGIRVNLVCPGIVDTPMHHRARTLLGDEIYDQGVLPSVHLKRAGQPEEIAQAIVFLCSDAASYITGTTLTPDGGLTLTV